MDRVSWRSAAVLSIVAIIGVVFVAVAALPYFQLTPQRLGRYWPQRWWLMVHITTGIVALMSGPVQLWLGLANRRTRLHRRLGATYISSVAISALAAYYLAFNTKLGWVFGAGLAGLATAWILTTGFAVLAIRRGLYEQHKEWMMRSYVATTAFITFRLLFSTLQTLHIGTLHEQLAVAAWFCWAVPLLVAEGAIQGRKILATSSASRAAV
jgi:uncharacterized membrane protein